MITKEKEQEKSKGENKQWFQENHIALNPDNLVISTEVELWGFNIESVMDENCDYHTDIRPNKMLVNKILGFPLLESRE